MSLAEITHDSLHRSTADEDGTPKAKTPRKRGKTATADDGEESPSKQKKTANRKGAKGKTPEADNGDDDEGMKAGVKQEDDAED